MNDQWKYQIRINLRDECAEQARRDPGDPALRPLAAILARHQAALVCQFDAFAGYVAEAEKQGIEGYPLYHWTRATIEDPAKRDKYLRSFTLHVNGEEVYAKNIADALEADMAPLVGGALVARMTRHDTNPANNPQPPARYRGTQTD